VNSRRYFNRQIAFPQDHGAWVFVSFLVQWAETVWGIEHPVVDWKPVRIGVRPLIVSILWTIFFIITWRL
jgi:hypothetical protein